eukprot:gene10770-13187_t
MNVHYGEGENTDWGPEQDKNSTRVMKTILEIENPDLVIFTGDIITGNNILNNASIYWMEALKVVMGMGIPWAVAFGNHDDLASGAGGTRSDLMAFDINLGSFSQFGPNNIPGISNYHLEIYDMFLDEVQAVIWIFDSGDISCVNNTASYCNTYITEEQVDWYLSEASFLYELTGPVWASAFFHIPLQEYMTVWNKEICFGTNNDSISCQPTNTGLFDAFQKIGDVKLVSVGHDHGNDFCGKLQDIELCFGRHSGYGGYGTWERGARVIELFKTPFESSISYSTWITYETGHKQFIQTLHFPESSNPQNQCN